MRVLEHVYNVACKVSSRTNTHEHMSQALAADENIAALTTKLLLERSAQEELGLDLDRVDENFGRVCAELEQVCVACEIERGGMKRQVQEATNRAAEIQIALEDSTSAQRVRLCTSLCLVLLVLWCLA